MQFSPKRLRPQAAAILFVVGLGLLLTICPSAQAQQPVPTAAVFPPQYDTNAWFINRETGNPEYLVAALFASEFLGVPAVGGVWTDGVRVEPWAAVPTAIPGTWVWLVANGPAGIIFPAPAGSAYPADWKDNKGNSGFIFTTP